MSNQETKDNKNMAIVLLLLVVADVFFFFNTTIALLFLAATLIFIVVGKMKLEALFPHFIIFSIPLLFLDDEYVYLLAIGIWIVISVVMLKKSIQNKRRASHCALCHEELTNLNVCVSGHLKDDYQICRNCITSFDLDFQYHIESKTLAEVQQKWEELHKDESFMDETDREVEELER